MPSCALTTQTGLCYMRSWNKVPEQSQTEGRARASGVQEESSLWVVATQVYTHLDGKCFKRGQLDSPMVPVNS